MTGLPRKMSLYRTEVFDAQSQRANAYGSVSAMPLQWSAITLLILSFIFVVAILLVVIDLPRVITAQGHLRFAHAESRIVVAQNATIDACHVKNNDQVSKGQKLVSFTTEQYSLAGMSLSEMEKQSLNEQIRSLDILLKNADGRALFRHQEVSARVKGYSDQLEAAQRQLESQRQRHEIAIEREMIALQNLNDGLITENDRHRAREEAAAIASSVISAEIEISRLNALIATSRVELSALATEAEDQKARISQLIAQTRSNLSSQSANQGYLLRSPINGTVTSNYCLAGEATTDKPVMVILPDNSHLIGDVLLPARAISLIETGQLVRLRYDAFPYQRFGLFHGKIISISDTTAEIGGADPVYRVLIHVQHGGPSISSRIVDLKSGMTFSTDIILEQQKAYKWLLPQNGKW